MAKKPRQDVPKIAGVGLDVHGAEAEFIHHQFTIPDDNGSGDVELNFSFPLTPTRRNQLMHMIEEGYSEHEAYVLLAGGEILAHIDAMKKARDGAESKRRSRRKENSPKR